MKGEIAEAEGEVETDSFRLSEGDFDGFSDFSGFSNLDLTKVSADDSESESEAESADDGRSDSDSNSEFEEDDDENTCFVTPLFGDCNKLLIQVRLMKDIQFEKAKRMYTQGKQLSVNRARRRYLKARTNDWNWNTLHLPVFLLVLGSNLFHLVLSVFLFPLLSLTVLS